VGREGERRNTYEALMGKPEGKRQLLLPGRRWENNIKIDVKGIV
jgi:hypothetical protein